MEIDEPAACGVNAFLQTGQEIPGLR